MLNSDKLLVETSIFVDSKFLITLKYSTYLIKSQVCSTAVWGVLVFTPKVRNNLAGNWHYKLPSTRAVGPVAAAGILVDAEQDAPSFRPVGEIRVSDAKTP